ncbi:MAG: hypothetical protein KDJ38_15455, partial [Gammaproteobacteria bacterium]|nr:hypothetical protein [Gammaproteobacteria bacterium]
MKHRLLVAGSLVTIGLVLVMACNGGDDSDASDSVDKSLFSKAMVNDAAYIPPQCYTETRDDDGSSHNPCFTCHQAG